MTISQKLKLVAAAAILVGTTAIATQSHAGSLDLSNTYAQAGGASGAGAAGGAGSAGSGVGNDSGTSRADEARDKLKNGIPESGATTSPSPSATPNSSSSMGVPAKCAAMKDANQRQLCINEAGGVRR